MDAATAEKRLYTLWGEISDLEAASDLLDWDQETNMPPGGVEARSKMVATLEGFKHRSLSSPELAEVLEVCAGAAPDGSVLAAHVRCARRAVDRAVKIPEALALALAEARVTGAEAWRRARAASDFGLFEAELEHLVELRRQEAAAIDPGGNAYDVLLDAYEPGVTEADLEPLFAELRGALIPLVRSVVASGVEIDEGAARGAFPAERQRTFGRFLAETIGFDFEAGRLDSSTHRQLPVRGQ